MRGLPKLLALTLALAATPVAAQPAPSASREVPAGGLIILPDPALTIEKQDVTIAVDQVRLAYEISNASSEPRTVQITFQLPELDATALAEQTINLPRPDPLNFVGALYSADGIERPAGFEQRAVAFGLDVTAELTGAGIPLFPYLPDTAGRLARLPDAIRTDFIERGVIRIEAGRIFPGWTVRTTAFWRQTFPPGRLTALSLVYQPLVGNGHVTKEALDTLRKGFCLSAAVEAGLARRAAPIDRRSAPLAWVHFALTAGSAWASPSTRFRLHVVKPAPDAIVATCRKGLRPAGPTVLEWTAEDFYADDDVAVLFIR